MPPSTDLPPDGEINIDDATQQLLPAPGGTDTMLEEDAAIENISAPVQR